MSAWRGRERGLRALGVELTLLAARSWHAGGAEVSLGAEEEPATVPVGTVGRHPALFLFDPRPVWRALGEQWDVIDIHEEPFSLAAAEILLLRKLRRNRAPVVLYTAQNIAKRYPVPFRWFERAALRAASGISACNSEAATITVAKGFAGRPRVVPLGVDLAAFSPGASSRATTEDAVITVGFVGRLVPEKGVPLLLEAVAGDARLRLRLAGAGPLAHEIGRRAASFGIAERVELLGSVPPEQIADFYRSVDVLAVPSVATPRWTEQFGRVAVEAMACGVPVVSSDAGALPEVVGGAGIVVPAGDAAALSDALVEAAGPRRAELVAAGFVRAGECSWDAVARDYLALYRSVLRAPAPGDELPPLEVIVVAYGTPDLLRSALEPIAHLPVTVVDNSSLPEIAGLCDELGVRYIDPGRNGGFGAGVNVALTDRLVPDGDVLLLNPDARISADQLDVLRAALRGEPDLASVAPAQVDASGRRARVRWPFPSPLNAVLEAVGLAGLRAGPRYVIGSVLVLRREALDQVGGFDESFFLYAEETDWEYRAHRLGWRHALVEDAEARHEGAATSTDSRRRDLHFHGSQERYYRKHFGAFGWQVTRAAIVAGAVARGILSRSADKRDLAWRRAALYLRGPLRAEAVLVGRPASARVD
ncbi:glycosyltransferase [Microbacterium sp.]|uniref:glycosyltransferase n=1 Tax=Microbacterium sp. TaxID=51671 RepID=UPI0037C53E0A